MRAHHLIVMGLFVACSPTGGDGSEKEADAARECEPEASRKCDDGHPHFVDSCEVVGERIETCEDNQVCEGAECRCAERFGGPVACHEGDVWRFDACGGLSHVVAECEGEEVCMDGVCVDQGCMDQDEICNGADDDCDGEVDEEDGLCPEGSDCVEGGCVGVGGFCDECQADRECRDGYSCAGYTNFPQFEKICVPSGCNDGVECPEGTACSENGVCWMVWTEACHEGNTWSFDVCERRVRMAEECDPERPCTNGRCIGEGEFCNECEGDRGCQEGFRCRGYGNFPDVPQVCVPESDCSTNPEAVCPDGLQCGGTGVCWLTWDTACFGEVVWNVDTCERRIQEAMECPERSPCQEGRCVGEGTTCDGCENEADCALNFVCRGYQNFPDVPQVCVPESNCAENSEDTCPDGLRCGNSGVCWMNLTPICREAGVDVWDYDTCGRHVRIREECGAERHCESVSGEAGSGGADGCADAAAVLTECWDDLFDEATFLASCEAEGTAAEVACITALTCDDAPEAVQLCLWGDRPGGECVDGPPAVCDGAIEGALGEQSGEIDGVNSFTGSCVEAEGPEQVVRFTAGPAGAYSFDTAGSAFDTVLYVRGACNDSETELACGDDGEDGVLSSRVEVELAEGQEVYAIIDGHGRSGAWTLTIEGPGG